MTGSGLAVHGIASDPQCDAKEYEEIDEPGHSGNRCKYDGTHRVPSIESAKVVTAHSISQIRLVGSSTFVSHKTDDQLCRLHITLNQGIILRDAGSDRTRTIRMTWKRVGLVLLALLAAASIYPGIPFGAAMETRSSPSGGQTVMTCYSLHWYGLHRKIITIRHEPNSPINVTNAACWRPPY